MGGVLDVAVPDLGRVEQAQRSAVVVRPAAGDAVAAPAARRRRARPRRRRAGCPAPADAAGAASAAPPAPAAAPPRRRRPPPSRSRSRPTCVQRHHRQQGGTLDRGSSCWTQADPLDRRSTWCCSTSSAQRLYVAQTGLMPRRRRRRPAEPPHADDAAARRAHARSRAERAEGQLRVARRSAASSWSKTYTFTARRLRDRRARTRSSTRRTRRSARGSTCSWCATATRRRASRASISPSPARRSTPRARSSRRSTSSASRSATPATSPTTRPRRQRLGRDGAALLRLGLAARQARRADAAARVLHRQGRHQHLLGRRCACRWATIAPGASKTVDARLFVGPQEEDKLAEPRARPRAGEGLRLVHDPRQAAVLAADAAAQADRQLGLGDRRPGRAAEDRLLLAQRQGLRLDGQDEGDQPEDHGDARAAEGQAAADAAGDDAHLPRGEGQSARRLPADRRADAVLHRALLGAAVDGRDAQRAVDRLDHRPVGEGPVLHPAAADDRAPACCRPGSTRRRPIRCRPR